MSEEHSTPADHLPCQNVTKALARITAIQWLLVIIVGVAMACVPIVHTTLSYTRETCDDLASRMKVAEDRYERNRQDFAEIKKILNELDNKVDELRQRKP